METMETQDLRIDRLDKLIVVTIENQTATLGLLRSIEGQVNRHSAILSEHSAILNEHSAILKEHSAILKEHSNRLSNLEDLVARIFEELVAIKDMLAAPRSMGFTPEPDDTAD